MKSNNKCTMCGAVHDASELTPIGDERLCPTCLSENTTVCDRCGDRIWNEDAEGDGYHTYCSSCYDHNYTRCTRCERIIHEDDAYYLDDDPYCYNCHEQEVRDNDSPINDYSYKPDPIFYGECSRYMGVELEIDDGGELTKNAEAIMAVANRKDEYLYCKHDGSLNDGLELVTHPMTLRHHLTCMPWSEILNKAKSLGYISHQAGSCGLHIHVNRTAFGDTLAEQEERIARVLYFFEKHWEELLKFSRRTQRQLERWAARYGLKEHPKEILDEAKGRQSFNRYTCVNLTNRSTIEFRMFRGTLKLNTLFATLQFIDRVCDVAIHLSDEEIKAMSWTTFVSGCTQPELVQYLKERRLYINEPVVSDEEV